LNPRRYVGGHWIDIGSLLAWFSYAAHERIVAGAKGHLLSAATGMNIAQGSALLPLIVLSLAVMSSWLRNELIKASPLTLSIAGCVAFFATSAD
jgi:hypothetical protein